MSQKHSVVAVRAAEKIKQCLREFAFHLDEVTPQMTTIIDREAVQPAQADLLEAAKDFVNKVETGRARSVDSYAKFKAAIQKAEATE